MRDAGTGADGALRQAVVEACRAMRARGLTRGTSGNVSVRCGDGLLISPTGVDYDALRPDQVVRLDADGRFGPGLLPSSEWRFHLAILRARPDLHAVVHTHSVHATAVSVLGREIPAIHYAIAAAGGGTVPCAPYATFGTEALALSITAALRDRDACLLRHHGAVAAGASLPRALALAETVEELAQMLLLCLPMGEPPVLPPEEIERVRDLFRTYGQQRASEPGTGG